MLGFKMKLKDYILKIYDQMQRLNEMSDTNSMKSAIAESLVDGLRRHWPVLLASGSIHKWISILNGEIFTPSA